MKQKPLHNILIILHFLTHLHHLHSEPTTTGFTCPSNTSNYPCQTYLHYAATSSLDLALIADLFSISQPEISTPSSISNPSSPQTQPLFIPITCSCNSINASYSISYAPMPYTIASGDTLYEVATQSYQYLTTYQSMLLIDPEIVWEEIEIGAEVIFPIFCKCVNKTLSGNETNFLVSYVFQDNDSLDSVAAFFGTSVSKIAAVNGVNPQPLDTIFVPVSQLPNITQPVVSPNVTGLIVGLVVSVLLFIDS